MLSVRHRPPWLGAAARLLVSALLLLFLMRNIDFRGLEVIFQRANVLLIGAAVLVLLGSPATSVPRWSAILQQLGHSVSVRTLARSLYIGAFFSQVLPSTVGGDVWRIWACTRAGVPLATATHSVLLERLAGMLVIVLFLAASSPWLLERIGVGPSRSVPWLLIAAGGVAVCAAAAVCGSAVTRVGQLKSLPLLRPFVSFGHAWAAVVSSGRLLCILSSTAVAGQLVAVMAMYLLARSIGAPLSFADCMVTLPPALLIAMVPISLAGWGVREGAFVAILRFYDVSREQALTLSVLFGLALMLASFPGLLLWLRQPAMPQRIRMEDSPDHQAQAR